MWWMERHKGSGYVPQVEAVDMVTTRIRDCLSCWTAIGSCTMCYPLLAIERLRSLGSSSSDLSLALEKKETHSSRARLLLSLLPNWNYLCVLNYKSRSSNSFGPCYFDSWKTSYLKNLTLIDEQKKSDGAGVWAPVSRATIWGPNH